MAHRSDIHIRVTPEMKAAIREAAWRARKEVTPYIRGLIADDLRRLAISVPPTPPLPSDVLTEAGKETEE